MESQNDDKRMKISNIVLIGILIFLFSSIVTGVGVYLWRESVYNEELTTLNTEISDLQDDLDNFQMEDESTEDSKTEVESSIDNSGISNLDEDLTDNWVEYTDPENIYSIRIPETWHIEDTFEQGNNLPKDKISYTNFNMGDTYMTLTIAKLYSATPEYKCRPEGGEYENLNTISLDGYTSYDAFSMYNLDADYKDTTAYTYCYDIQGKKLSFEFIPEASKNTEQGIEIFYQILKTIDFK